MPALAFRISAHDANALSSVGQFFDEGIVEITGSPYCHVELWLDGPVEQARCFSSRQPNGCDWAFIDLRDQTAWKIVDLPPVRNGAVSDAVWFCNGSIGQPYDFAGIAGIALDNALHDPTRRFCSEKVFEIGQWCFGWRKDIPRWHVAPGWTRGGDRHGLYEMATSNTLTV